MPESGKIGAIELPIKRVHIEVTSRCNFSCEFCPDMKMQRERGTMDLALVKRALDEVAEEKLANLVLFHVMGEPLLYPHINEAVGYATEKGLKTCITTNGALLDEAAMEGLIEAGLTRMILSLQTPDSETFKFRGAKGLSFEDYRTQVMRVARMVMDGAGVELSISFLSSPLRRLIFPVMPDISVADTSKDLQKHLRPWAEELLRGSAHEGELPRVLKRIKRAWSFTNNTIPITGKLKFETRILGDWAGHSTNSKIKAKIGCCPGIRENFGVLWDGSLVFCCVDYEGKTSSANLKDTTISKWLASEPVQSAVRGFDSLKVVHPYCQNCLGDKNHFKSVVRQLGSIAYFKGYRKLFAEERGAAD